MIVRHSKMTNAFGFSVWESSKAFDHIYIDLEHIWNFLVEPSHVRARVTNEHSFCDFLDLLSDPYDGLNSLLSFMFSCSFVFQTNKTRLQQMKTSQGKLVGHLIIFVMKS